MIRINFYRKILLQPIVKILIGFCIISFYLNNSSAQEIVIEKTNHSRLQEMEKTSHLKQKKNYELAYQKALKKGWIIRQKTPEGAIMSLQGLDEFGKPFYYTTFNSKAAKTVSTDKVWSGGISGYNINGNGIIIGEWDGGGVLTTHQELTGRVFQQDTPSEIIDHSTHVSGTLIASGINPDAKGMAPEAVLHAWDNTYDINEMVRASLDGLLLSNHSYGLTNGWNEQWKNLKRVWVWYGETSISEIEDYRFGFYTSLTSDLDQIAYLAPYYFIVQAAGNDRDDIGPGAEGLHYIFVDDEPVESTTTRDQDGGTDGYDCLDPRSVSKNVLTVSSVLDIPNGYNQSSDVISSDFSAWGPTDDGRIKPDIVGNGDEVTSTGSWNDEHYYENSGTSMAAPNVTGSCALLQEYYMRLNNDPMQASTLKALVLHTADEAGAADGPDYRFGWGLLNTEKAAKLISDEMNHEAIIKELILINGESYSSNISSGGYKPIKVTLCWTDPAGTPPAASLNPTTPMLVNDLDLRVTQNGITYEPWILDPASPSNPATHGDNYRDNVESIYILSPVAGNLSITVTHKGTLTGELQEFSLIVSGINIPCPGTPTVTDYNGNIYGTVQIGNQCWMRENLKATNYANGAALNDGTSIGDITGDYTSKYYFSYNNNVNSVSTYGRLYTWAAVMNEESSSNYNPSSVQGVCPTGWHVPSDAEWKELTSYLGELDNSGGKLKESGTSHWLDPNTDATNESGFTGLPNGVRFNRGTYQYMGYYGVWWASTESDEMSATTRGLNYNSGHYLSGFNSDKKDYGFSVRCVKDVQNSLNDSLVLVTLYNSTDGNNWAAKDNWLTGPLHTWQGIIISGGRVIGITLSSNNLIGSIPSEIGNLDKLKYLNLYNNQLIGTIPPEIETLLFLQNLNLEGNQLTGNIPQEIGNLPNLQILNLANNQLSGIIPPEIGTLSSLQRLYLTNNQLDGPIPPEMGDLSNLLYLYLENNQLNGNIPVELGDLSNLEGFQARSNQLTGSIPSEIGNLSSLIALDLGYNDLSGDIPENIKSALNLSSLTLRNNSFISLPELNTLTNLISLDIQSNQFTFGDIEPNIGIPSGTFLYSPQSNIGDEQIINLVTGDTYEFSAFCGGNNNQYQWYKNSQAIPGAQSANYIIHNATNSNAGDYHCQVTNTVAIDLTIYSQPIHLIDNQYDIATDSLALVAFYNATLGENWTNHEKWLTGPIISWFGVTLEGDRVTRVDLGSNNLSGKLTSEIGNLSQLNYLWLGGNNLTGNIPTELFNLTNLEYLHLGNNQLTGELSPDLGNLNFLQTLILWYNQLSGDIPNEINQTSLEYAYLNDNQFINLPDLEGLSSLMGLRVYNNILTFEDIEPNIGIPQLYFQYTPQSIIGHEQSVTLHEGEDFNLSITCGGFNNQYQWYKDELSIPNADQSEYQISSVQLSDAGDYYCRITNAVATELTIFSNPIHVTVSGHITFNKPLTAGWNWFSVNVVNDDMSLENLFTCATEGDYIKSQILSATYYNNYGWYGSLEDAGGIIPIDLYKFKAMNPCQVDYSGIPVNVHNTPIHMVAGWNWIGYLPQVPIPINEALGSLTIEQFDYIKNQFQSATFYDEYGWYGSLIELIPSNGYMMNKLTTDVLIYPSISSTGIEIKQNTNILKVVKEFSFNPHQFEYSGSVTARVYIDGALAGSKNNLVLAYVNDQLRGVSGGLYFKPAGAYTFPIMVYSNLPEGETLTFRYYDSEKDRVYPCDGTLNFREDMIEANAFESFELHVNTAVGMEDLTGEDGLSLEVYPNPFSDKLHIEYSIAESTKVLVAVYDMLGKVVEILNEQTLNPGSYSIEWSAEAYQEATYILKISTESSSKLKRIILIR